jgi:hypothetical protein
MIFFRRLDALIVGKPLPEHINEMLDEYQSEPTSALLAEILYALEQMPEQDIVLDLVRRRYTCATLQ